MGVPTPFQRPSINLNTEKKDWLDIEIQDVRVGELVRGYGEAVSVVTDDSSDMTVVVWKNGTRSVFSPDDVVTVFTTV